MSEHFLTWNNILHCMRRFGLWYSNTFEIWKSTLEESAIWGPSTTDSCPSTLDVKEVSNLAVYTYAHTTWWMVVWSAEYSAKRVRIDQLCSLHTQCRQVGLFALRSVTMTTLNNGLPQLIFYLLNWDLCIEIINCYQETVIRYLVTRMIIRNANIFALHCIRHASYHSLMKIQ